MNLIICHTPLQVLIAEKIIRKYPGQDFYGIMFTFESYNNQKFKAYQERLKKQCNVSFLFQYPQKGGFALFAELLKAKNKVRGLKVDKLFIASIDDQFVQMICSSVKFNRLETFDDGTANIVRNSIYYRNSPETWKRRLSNCLLGNRYDTQTLRKMSAKHYSIYPSIPNITDNVEPISFAKKRQNSTACHKPPVRLLLGQPLFNDDRQNIRLAAQAVKRFGIDAYLPHPRESYRLDNVDYVETELIFEDYIVKAAEERKYTVYTYFSGAVLSVTNHPNIEVISIRPPLTDPVYLACYDLFEQVGIHIIDFEL